jgi:hypothetical protein
MRFYTSEECENWVIRGGLQKPSRRPGMYREVVPFHDAHSRIWPLALWMSGSLPFRRPTLLWITQTDIWQSGENWHLYYRLRQSYGDLRLLHEAPGHLFLPHESDDLASFLQLAMLNGWDGYVMTELDYVSASISHDGFVDFFSARDENLADVREVFGAKPTPGGLGSVP